MPTTATKKFFEAFFGLQLFVYKSILNSIISVMKKVENATLLQFPNILNALFFSKVNAQRSESSG
jgi:hypothetical protein